MMGCATEPEMNDEYPFYLCYINSDNPNCKVDENTMVVTYYTWFSSFAECESVCPDSEFNVTTVDTSYTAYSSCYQHNDTTCVDF